MRKAKEYVSLDSYDEESSEEHEAMIEEFYKDIGLKRKR